MVNNIYSAVTLKNSEYEFNQKTVVLGEKGKGEKSERGCGVYNKAKASYAILGGQQAMFKTDE